VSTNTVREAHPASAILVAAGRGERLGQETPKARVPLQGIPIFLYSLRTILRHPGVDKLLLVINPDGAEERIYRRLLEEEPGAEGRVRLLPGGDRRQDSVRRGLEVLWEDGMREDGIAVIHDAARPLLTTALLTRCLEAMIEPYERGHQRELPGLASSSSWAGCPAGVVPATPMRETLKLVFHGRVVLTQPRENLYAVQTPQVFRLGPILRAHRKAVEYNFEASDDAGLLEWQGVPVSIVPGENINLKITYPEDLELARRILEGRDYAPPDGFSRVEL